MNEKIRVALLSNEVKATSLIQEIVSNSTRLTLTECFNNSNEFVNYANRPEFDILIVAYHSLSPDHLKKIQDMKSLINNFKLIGIVNDNDKNMLLEFLKEGFDGCVLNSHVQDKILDAIEVCHLGGIYVSEKNIREEIIKGISENYFLLNNVKLSEREKQIAKLYCDGLTYRQIAIKLKISPETVRTHLKNFHCKIKSSFNGFVVKKRHRTRKTQFKSR